MTARRPVSDEPLMPLADVAARLGVPVKTFRRWREHGRAPLGYRLGGRISYRWSEVEAWLQQQREQPTVRPTLHSTRRAS